MDEKTISRILIVMLVGIVCVGYVAYTGCQAQQKVSFNDGYSAGFSATAGAFAKGNEMAKTGWYVQSVTGGNITLCKTGTKCCKVIDKNYNEVASEC